MTVNYCQVYRVEARCSPTAIKTPGAVETNGSMRVIEDEIVDAPFFANDGLERSKKTGRRLATFKLHAGLDLEKVQVTNEIFYRLKSTCVPPRYKNLKKKRKH